MSVALALKFHSDPHCNHDVRRSDEDRKCHQLFRLIWSLFVTTLLSSHWRERNRIWNESTALERQREINHHRTSEADANLDLFFATFTELTQNILFSDYVPFSIRFSLNIVPISLSLLVPQIFFSFLFRCLLVDF